MRTYLSRNDYCFAFLGILSLILFSCGATKSSHKNSIDLKGDSTYSAPESRARAEPNTFLDTVKNPPSPEKTEELLGEVTDNWLFGQGIGETALTVGTVVAFPPFAIWVLGNAALQVSGEEPLQVSDMLPEESGKIWQKGYDGLTSIPGRTTALVAGEEFRDKELARQRIEAVLKKEDSGT